MDIFCSYIFFKENPHEIMKTSSAHTPCIALHRLSMTFNLDMFSNYSSNLDSFLKIEGKWRFDEGKLVFTRISFFTYENTGIYDFHYDKDLAHCVYNHILSVSYYKEKDQYTLY